MRKDLNIRSGGLHAFGWVVRVAAGGAGIAAGLIWLRCVYLVFGFRLVSDPLFDPSGYGLIGGTVISVPAAVVTAAAVPFAFPAPHRRQAVRVVTPVLAVVTASLWGAFLTA